MKQRSTIILSVLVLIVLGLFVPFPESEIEGEFGYGEPQEPFVWAQDSVWSALEEMFARTKDHGCDSVNLLIGAAERQLRSILVAVRERDLAPSDPLFVQLEEGFFRIAPLVATCPDAFSSFLQLAEELRATVKQRSRDWDMNDRVSRSTMYRTLYGSRAALEEVMLQLPFGGVPDLVKGVPEPSVTPSTTILGVRIHSGDILVSRGGAPTSALIARGNDFPGNFSHVALLHVDSLTQKGNLIEAHIEKGVAVATVEEYLKDTKLRVMVLRLRHDLPAVRTDPMLPHRAAIDALADATTRHIPYDFEMRHDDPSKLFCSEVASAAYGRSGIRLWMGTSTISEKGLRSWLGAFGVRYFETQEPSDLEYDPQLTVVAEWRNQETLYQDHMDNAVTEAMLEGAARGDRLTFDWYLLPVGRVMKLVSVVANWMGKEGPVPEGMSAPAALRNRWYSERHAAARALVMTKADAFVTSQGYRPPYWRLLEMAREALRGSSSPAESSDAG